MDNLALNINRQNLERSQTSWYISLIYRDAPQSYHNNKNIYSFRAYNKTKLSLYSNALYQKPLISANDNCDIVFDGYLFNSNELLERLDLKNQQLDNLQIIHKCYKKWGIDFVKEIKGVYFIFIRDSLKDICICVRDRLGVYPVFYFVDNKKYVFSNSISSILSNPEVSVEFDRVALADHLCKRWTLQNDTYYKNILRIPAGNYLTLKDNKVQIKDYWGITKEWVENNWIEDKEVDGFIDVLKNSIKKHVSLGPTSIFLSGGLDSVTVATTANEIIKKNNYKNLLALSLIFPMESEEPVQKGVAETLKIEQFIVTLEDSFQSGNFLETALNYSKNLSQPIMHIWIPGYKFLLKEAKNRGYKILLTGNGGDEWLGVNPYYMADLIKSLDFSGAYKLYKNIINSYSLNYYHTLKKFVWLFGLRALLVNTMDLIFAEYMHERRKRNYSAGIHEWIAPDPQVRKGLEQRMNESLENNRANNKKNGEYGFYLSNLSDYMHPINSREYEEIFEYSNEIDMMILHPFLDSDVVEYLVRIKPHLLYKDQRSKAVVRGYINSKYPNLGFLNQKKVLSLDLFNSLVFKEFRKLYDTNRGVKFLDDIGVINQSLFSKYVDEVLNQDGKRGAFNIWNALNLNCWAESKIYTN